MPEYLAPGVYVEETSFRAKSIEGVSTSTTAFVGSTRKGPTSGPPMLVTSFGEFTRIFGGGSNLSYTAGTDTNPPTLNFMSHAVRSFFLNGGARLYIARTFTPRTGGSVASSADLPDGAAEQFRFRARVPGSGLNGVVRVTEKRVPATQVTLDAAPVGSLMQEGGGAYFVKTEAGYRDASDAAPAGPPPTGTELITMNVDAVDADGTALLYEDLGFDAEHPLYVGAVLVENPSRRTDDLQNPYWFDADSSVTPFILHDGLFSGGPENTLALTGGNDGDEPTATSTDAAHVTYATALLLLEDVEDISIVAAPGHSALTAVSFQAVQQRLIAHCENMRYRVAVLDSPAGQALGEVRATRSLVDSKYAALYYPWVMIANPLARAGNERIPKEIAVPPSGFMCGIYARNDSERGVWKAPANEVVRGALRFEREINHAQQEVLNPEGINCLRYFFGRGNRVWGARTVSSDPEWKYVNVRRYFVYLERSIDRGSQWAVFEPNGEALWANIRETVSAFLYNEWVSGALLGSTPEEAYFVRCDRSTMTQNDLDNGRLICEIGVAVLKPAEFVIFRIGQKTADSRA